jgi:tetratricopeptide (TPR) repeat protein
MFPFIHNLNKSLLLLFWATGLFAVVVFSGCSNNPSAPAETHDEVFHEIVELIREQGLQRHLARQYDDSLLIAACLHLAGEVVGGSVELKWGYYNQAINFAETRNLRKALADIYVSIYQDDGLSNTDFPVDSLLKEAVNLYRTLGYHSEEMDAYRYLSVIAFQRGDYREALHYSEMALELGQKHGFAEKSAIIHSNMALMYTKTGDYQKANEYNFNALRIFESLRNQLQIARVNLSVGTVYSLLKEKEKALEYMETALDTFREINDLRGQSISLTNLASIYRQTGDTQKALNSYQQAVAIDKETNDLQGISSNYNGIGEIYFSQGDFNTAMGYYLRSLDIKKSTSDKSGEGDVYVKIASVRRQQGQLSEAIRYLKMGLSLFEETGELSKKRNTLEMLAGTYEQAGDYKTALPLFKEASFLKDSLINVEKAVNIALLEEKYLNEKLEYENLSLKYRNDLQHARMESKKRLMNAYLLALFLSAVAMVVIFVQLRKKNRAFRVLYQKNVDLIKKEHQIRTMKNQLEQEPIERIASSIPEEERQRLIKRLERTMESEKVFTKPNLTIEKLAKKLNTNRTYLSQVINEEYQMKYSDYINKQRVNEAMLLLSNLEKSSRFSIEAIAREAGFNTTSNFNSVFKKHAGITPSLFRKEAEEQQDRSVFFSSKLTKLAQHSS